MIVSDPTPHFKRTPVAAHGDAEPGVLEAPHGLAPHAVPAGKQGGRGPALVAVQVLAREGLQPGHGSGRAVEL